MKKFEIEPELPVFDAQLDAEIRDIEHRASFWLAAANNMAGRGRLKTSEKYERKAQRWLDKANRLRESIHV